MHAVAVLQKLLRRSIPSLHFKRLVAVTAVVSGALVGGRLTLSSLARNLDSTCCVRHRIKRVDRLLGNEHLADERMLFYRVLCNQLIGDRREPVLIVDWSDLKPDRSWLLLRACVWVHGFALPIYEEVHPLRLQHHRRVQRDFLLTLRMLLSDNVRPIVITDAGFRSPWFQEVERLGWHWVGRIRNRTMIEIRGHWRHGKTLYPQATATPHDLGVMRITRANPVSARLTLFRKSPKGRRHINHYGEIHRCKHSRKNAAREREPWLIASSVSLSGIAALEIINLYRVRMRIEHSFRTLKSHQFGFAFEDSQSRQANRLAALLVIHALAVFLAWIAGCAVQRAGLDNRLRSNANARRTALSIVSLGWLALTLLGLNLTQDDFIAAIHTPPLLPSHDKERK